MTEMTDAVTTTIRTAPAANPQSPDHSRGQAQSRTGRGSLTICGLGFHRGHLTLETVATIVRAEKLLYGGNGAGTGCGNSTRQPRTSISTAQTARRADGLSPSMAQRARRFTRP